MTSKRKRLDPRRHRIFLPEREGEDDWEKESVRMFARKRAASNYTAIAKKCAVIAYPVPPFKNIH